MISGGKLCILNEISPVSSYKKSKLSQLANTLSIMMEVDEYKKKKPSMSPQSYPCMLYRFDENDQIRIVMNPDYVMRAVELSVTSPDIVEYSNEIIEETKTEGTKLNHDLEGVTKDQIDFSVYLNKLQNGFSSFTNNLILGNSNDKEYIDWIPDEYSTYWNEIELDIKKKFKNSLAGKVRLILYKYFESLSQKFKKKERVDTIEFFEKVKDAFELLEAPKSDITRLQKYIDDLNRLKSNNTLVRKAASSIMASISEDRLAKDHYKYLSESQIVDFIRRSRRGLAFTYLRYYEMPIPDEVIKKFEKAEDTLAFDDYVILHYVGDNKSSVKKNAVEEKARRKDPILFGLIKGSRKLYYIADWITEDDDLTLEKLLGEINGEAEEL